MVSVLIVGRLLDTFAMIPKAVKDGVVTIATIQYGLVGLKDKHNYETRRINDRRLGTLPPIS